MERWIPPLAGLSGQSYDPAVHARMKADTVNSTPGELTGCDCPKCRNRGSVAVPREDGSITFRECGCMKVRRCIWEMERSGLRNIIREKTFETFLAREPWQSTVKAGAMAYAEKPEGWLLLCGQSGSGKTHLCTAVCRKRLLQGDEVRYLPWRDTASRLKSLAMESQQRSELLEGFKNAGLLYIDDLFKTGSTSGPTGADISLAFELLNYRYINHLSTVISTEKTVQELVDIDEATGSRIVEQCGGNVFSIARNEGRNYRLRGVVEL